MKRHCLKLALCIVLQTLLWVPSAWADIPLELSGKSIVEIEIEGESAEFVDPQDIGLRKGLKATRRVLRKATLDLLKSGRWTEVHFDLVGLESGVKLVVHLKPKINLLRIDVVGNDVLDDEEVIRALGVAEGSEVRSGDIENYKKSLTDLYSGKGYERSKVEIVLRDTDNPGSKVLRVVIAEAEPTRLLGVSFTGKKPQRNSTVFSKLPRVGDIFDRADVDKKIEETQVSLREAGWFDARVVIERTEEDPRGVYLVLRAVSGPKFDVKISGFSPISRGEVLRALTVGAERLSDAGVVESMEKRVSSAYQRLGFLDPNVKIWAVKHKKRDGLAHLFVRIDKGQPTRVAQLRFPGASHYDQEFLQGQIAAEVREQLETGVVDGIDTETINKLISGTGSESRRTPKHHHLSASELYNEDVYAAAIERVQELYESDGFLSAKVGMPELTRVDKTQVKVSIPIEEGPRTFLYRASVTGNTAFTSRDVLLASELTRGKPFSRAALSEAEGRVRKFYQEEGYFYAEVDSTLSLSPDSTRAWVKLNVNERFPVTIDEVQVLGAERTSESLIRSVFNLDKGELMRLSTLRDAQQRVLALGVFSSVSVAPVNPDLPAQVKSIEVQVSELKNYYLGGGVQISTAQGLSGDLEVGFRNLGKLAIGLTLRAQLRGQLVFFDPIVAERFQSLTTVQKIERLVTVGVTVPYFGIENVALSFIASHQRENERNFGLDRNGGSLSFVYRRDRRFSLTLSTGLEFNNVDLYLDEDTYEEILANTTDPRIRDLLRVPRGLSALLYASLSATVDFRDSPFIPKRGFYGAATAEWARTVFDFPEEGRDTFFSHHVRVFVEAAGYIPLGRGVVIAMQGRAGRVLHAESSSETYPNRQFFMGGVDTIRGYLQDSMIPQDLVDYLINNPELSPSNIIQGGDTFLVLRGELRFPIPLFQGLQGGFFADFGNLWADPTEFNPLQLRPTGGVGIRFETPVGTLAFDYGWLLQRRPELNERTGAFHFSFQNQIF